MAMTCENVKSGISPEWLGNVQTITLMECKASHCNKNILFLYLHFISRNMLEDFHTVLLQVETCQDAMNLI